ncbi:M23 family metallopeptidase [Winogradskyella sp.]|uniref:M23 family metallopeptidase n=1 Tax=Winogradskyella sp. TaxID=1883156 RepID=UPI003BABBEA0
MNRILKYLICTIVIFSCNQNREPTTDGSNPNDEGLNLESEVEISNDIDYKSLFLNNPQYIAKDFDFPITKSNIMGMRNFNTQKFGANNNLADNSNAVGAENIYLDKPVYAIGNGYITEAKANLNKWGNVIRIVHLLDGHLYESLYAHCNKMLVKPNQFIKKGEQIGTIITCNKLYHTHLRFEIRDSLGMAIGDDYSADRAGYLDPNKFIKTNRN